MTTWQARLAWALVALGAIAVVIDTAVTAAYRPLFSEGTWAEHGWPLATVAAVIAAVMGALIISRYPRHPIGWLLIVCGVPSSLSLAFETYSLWVSEHDGPGSEAVGHVTAWLSLLLGAQIAFTGLTLIILIAPDGHLASRPWRHVARAVVLGLALFTLGVLATPPSSFSVIGSSAEGTGPVADRAGLGLLLIFGTLVVSPVSMFRRLRRSQGEVRQQLRWIAGAALGLAVGVITYIAVQIVNGGDQNWLAALPLFLAYLAFPLCIAVAVLRHGLFDLDLVVNRALVLTLATALVAAGYVTLVVLVGGNAGGFWPSLLATVVVALAFQPLRSRVVRVADRLTYGRRAVPYEALAEFGRNLERAPGTGDLLRHVAGAVGAAAGARAVTAVLELPDAGEVASTWPTAESRVSTGEPASMEFAVVDRGERLGRVDVLMPAGHAIRDEERELVQRLLGQAALALRNLRLETELANQVAELDRRTLALDVSRRRLVVARDAEKARFAADLRRRVLPTLTPLPDELEEMAQRVRAGRDGVDAIELEPSQAAATNALDELRRLVRGFGPTPPAQRDMRDVTKPQPATQR